MSFLDSYKRLEKLCSEMYGELHGLSAYIDEMISKPNGAYYVPGWNEDLKLLKHYRWVRNKITHDPGCSEENMCEPDDAHRLDDFYYRIMNRTDPLALYLKATKSRPRAAQKAEKAEQAHYPQTPRPTANRKKSSSKLAGCMTFLLGILILAITIILLSKILL